MDLFPVYRPLRSLHNTCHIHPNSHTLSNTNGRGWQVDVGNILFLILSFSVHLSLSHWGEWGARLRAVHDRNMLWWLKWWQSMKNGHQLGEMRENCEPGRKPGEGNENRDVRRVSWCASCIQVHICLCLLIMAPLGIRNELRGTQQTAQQRSNNFYMQETTIINYLKRFRSRR